MNKKILITGSKGFISRNLKKYLENKNYIVFSTSRNKNNLLYFDLRNLLDTKISIPKFDILIHLAYLRDNSLQIEKKYNINGAKKIFSLAKKNKAKIIYVSSQSADPNSYSNYGKIKYEIEKIALQFQAIIIRPGLIYEINSDMGIYGKINKLIKNFPFIIVPKGLNRKINLCNIETLNKKIYDVSINNNFDQKIKLFEHKNYNLIELVKHISKINDKDIKIIYVNYRIVLYLLLFFEFFKIKFDFSSDSLKSLIN